MAPSVICDETIQMAKELKAGEILLLENMRFEKGETKNDEELVLKISFNGRCLYNDAFGVSHRASLISWRDCQIFWYGA